MKYLLFVLVLVSFNSYAKMYKCKDADGKYTYSEFQCKNESENQVVTVKEDPRPKLDMEEYERRAHYDREFYRGKARRDRAERLFLINRDFKSRSHISRQENADSDTRFKNKYR